jgi:putative membrane protein
MTGHKHGLSVGILIATLTLWGLPPARADSKPNDAAPAAPTAATSAPKAPAAHGVAPADLEVLKALHASSQIDIKVGKMAKDRAGSEMVKSFAAKMVSDHGMVEKKIAKFLSNRGLRVASLGAVASALPPALVAYKDKTGAAYDHAFTSQMTDDYQALIALVEKASKDTADDAFRSLLGQLLPALRVLEATGRVLSDRKDPP